LQIANILCFFMLCARKNICEDTHARKKNKEYAKRFRVDRNNNWDSLDVRSYTPAHRCVIVIAGSLGHYFYPHYYILYDPSSFLPNLESLIGSYHTQDSQTPQPRPFLCLYTTIRLHIAYPYAAGDDIVSRLIWPHYTPEDDRERWLHRVGSLCTQKFLIVRVNTLKYTYERIGAKR
jgi:hypothetical protein